MNLEEIIKNINTAQVLTSARRKELRAKWKKIFMNDPKMIRKSKYLEQYLWHYFSYNAYPNSPNFMNLLPKTPRDTDIFIFNEDGGGLIVKSRGDTETIAKRKCRGFR